MALITIQKEVIEMTKDKGMRRVLVSSLVLFAVFLITAGVWYAVSSGTATDPDPAAIAKEKSPRDSRRNSGRL